MASIKLVLTTIVFFAALMLGYIIKEVPMIAQFSQEEGFFIATLVVVGLIVAAAILYGLACLLGIGFMWLRDRTTGKRRLYAVRRG